jgi:hypothetical protein
LKEGRGGKGEMIIKRKNGKNKIIGEVNKENKCTIEVQVGGHVPTIPTELEKLVRVE